MSLVWKLLRRHISLPQLSGFFLANLLGMLIVLLSLQFYRDIRPAFGVEDSFIKPDYLILNKRVAATGLLGGAGASSAFSSGEVEDIRRQPFCRSVGAFTASRYKVACHLGLGGAAQYGTEMFFESVPDRYIDADLSQWTFTPDEPLIPIILPRTYLAIYNFGFAQSQSLPKLNEGVVGMIDLTAVLRGAGQTLHAKARVIGFSNRLNTILVPESFMQWSNAMLAPEADTAPSRLILEVKNPTDPAIAAYISAHGYELEDDKLEAGKATYFLRVVTGIVMAVGLLISALSFYILMLSIYLLVQKNTDKLLGLLLIGYSPWRVSLPYQALTIGMNGAVVLIALGLLTLVRGTYLRMLWAIFPQLREASVLPVVGVAAALFVLVSLVNVVAVRRRVMEIWKGGGR